jgi:ABC-type antimicrobial peptide transport system permease subunit
VVGLVRDARYNTVTEPTMPYLYVAYAQEGGGDTTLIVRTRVAATSVLPQVRSALKAFDNTMTIYGVVTLSEHMREALYVERTAAQLVVSLGLLGLGLAIVGLYGVLAYYVSRRRQEIGVRLALGAHARAVFLLVVRRGLLLAAIGTVLGMAGSLAVTRYLSNVLFGVSPRDPLTLVVVACLLLAVTILAAAVPARRAARVDPIIALRCE